MARPLLCLLGFHDRQCRAHFGWFDEWCTRCGKRWKVPWISEPGDRFRG